MESKKNQKRSERSYDTEEHHGSDIEVANAGRSIPARRIVVADVLRDAPPVIEDPQTSSDHMIAYLIAAQEEQEWQREHEWEFLGGAAVENEYYELADGGLMTVKNGGCVLEYNNFNFAAEEDESRTVTEHSFVEEESLPYDPMMELNPVEPPAAISDLGADEEEKVYADEMVQEFDMVQDWKDHCGKAVAGAYGSKITFEGSHYSPDQIMRHMHDSKYTLSNFEMDDMISFLNKQPELGLAQADSPVYVMPSLQLQNFLRYNLATTACPPPNEVRRAMTKLADLGKKYNEFLIPVLWGGHWTLVYINKAKLIVEWRNSLWSDDFDIARELFIKIEHIVRNICAYPASAQNHLSIRAIINCGQQADTYSCGYFVWGWILQYLTFKQFYLGMDYYHIPGTDSWTCMQELRTMYWYIVASSIMSMPSLVEFISTHHIIDEELVHQGHVEDDLAFLELL